MPKQPSKKRKPEKYPKHRGTPEHVGFKKIQKYNNLTLPDGTHRRKLEKIKKVLIHKAKVHQSFRKVQGHEKDELESGKKRFLSLLQEAELEKKERKQLQIMSREEEVEEGPEEVEGEGGGEDQRPLAPESKIHAPKQAITSCPIKRDDPSTSNENPSTKKKIRKNKLEQRHIHKSRRSRFAKEESEFRKAVKLKEEQAKEAARQKAEKAQKELERQKLKKLITAKTANGKPKLGNQGIVLLEKLKRQLSKQ